MQKPNDDIEKFQACGALAKVKVDEALEKAGLGFSGLVSRLASLVDAKKTVFQKLSAGAKSKVKGVKIYAKTPFDALIGVEVEDNSIRLSAIDTALKIGGHYAPVKSKIGLDDDPMRKLIAEWMDECAKQPPMTFKQEVDDD